MQIKKRGDEIKKIFSSETAEPISFVVIGPVVSEEKILM
jgi:hypothetical protein